MNTALTINLTMLAYVSVQQNIEGLAGLPFYGGNILLNQWWWLTNLKENI